MKPAITAIILAGGAGSRIGGSDKGLQQFRNKAMVEWVVDALSPQVDQIIISANRNLQSYQALGFEVVSDENHNQNHQLSPAEQYQGPLAGIVAAHRSQAPEHVRYYLVCPCDSPLIPTDYVSRLRASLDTSGKSAAVVHDGVRRQNLHCLLNRDLVASLVDYFERGGRSMRGWMSHIDVNEVDFSDQATAFTNLNTMA